MEGNVRDSKDSQKEEEKIFSPELFCEFCLHRKAKFFCNIFALIIEIEVKIINYLEK